MSNTIYVGIDGSEASLVAVEWAANAAMKRGEVLRIAISYTLPQFLYAEGMVPPQELYDDLLSEAMEKINRAADAARAVAPDIEIGHVVAEGSPIDMLLDLSKEATMIVMGSRGLGGLSGMVMGSVSAAVVSHALCPVVVVREDNKLSDETKYGPVVVGIDGSDVSRKAADVAFAEASARNAELIAVHTWMDMSVQSSLAGVAAAQRVWDEVEDEQDDLLQAELEGYENEYPDVTVKKVITRDRPVRALAEHSHGAQLLVVGSHGRGGFKGMLLGSTSRALLQSAACPLMVVRPD